MTVDELITELLTLPKDAEVRRLCREDGWPKVGGAKSVRMVEYEAQYSFGPFIGEHPKDYYENNFSKSGWKILREFDVVVME